MCASLTDAPAANETMLLSIALDGALPGNAVDAARFVRISANADSFDASTWNNGGRLLYLEVTGALATIKPHPLYSSVPKMSSREMFP